MGITMNKKSDKEALEFFRSKVRDAEKSVRDAEELLRNRREQLSRASCPFTEGQLIRLPEGGQHTEAKVFLITPCRHMEWELRIQVVKRDGTLGIESRWSSYRNKELVLANGLEWESQWGD